MITVTRDGVEIVSFSRSCRVQKNDVGTLSFQALRDNPDALNLGVEQERFVAVVTDDLTATDVTMMIGRTGPWTQEHDSPGEESSQMFTVGLPGALSTLTDAIVYPRIETGVFSSKADTRFFNFASPDWDGWLDWGAAVELFMQGDAGSSLFGYTNPKDWPDPEAFWIWGTTLGPTIGDAAAVGPCYFRTPIEVDEATAAAIYITADDTWKLYVDGEVLEQHDGYGDWQRTYRVNINLNAGTHTIGVLATNQNFTYRYAGLLVSIFAVVGDDELQTLIAHTDDTWSCLPYPATAPGMTPGEIMIILIEEALARGALTIAGDAWDYDFTGDLDSNGDAWALEVEITMRIGESVLDALRKLGETWVDFRVDMATQTLQMVNKGAFNTNPAVTLFEGINLSGLTFDGSASARAVVLTRDADGNYSEMDAQVGGDRVESLLQAGSAPSGDAANTAGAGALIATAPGPVMVRAVVESIAGATPLKDFNVFDVIQMPNANGSATATEITAITAADIPDGDDGAGFTAYVVEGEQGRLTPGSVVPGSGGGVIDPEAPPTEGPGGSNILFNLEFG